MAQERYRHLFPQTSFISEARQVYYLFIKFIEAHSFHPDFLHLMIFLAEGNKGG